jgi:hypothetical protein
MFYLSNAKTKEPNSQTKQNKTKEPKGTGSVNKKKNTAYFSMLEFLYSGGYVGHLGTSNCLAQSQSYFISKSMV